MKKYLILIGGLGVIAIIILIYFLKAYNDYKFFKSEEFRKLSSVIYNINETYFNNYLQYPENGDQLIAFSKSDNLYKSITGKPIPKIIEKYGLGLKLLEDSIITVYSYSFNKKNNWPNLLYNINNLSFYNFIFGKNDILISEVSPPSHICDFVNRKLLLNSENKKIESKDLDKSINKILRSIRIKYYSSHSVDNDTLSLAYFKFERDEKGNIDLQIMCTNQFSSKEFHHELKILMKELMIKNDLKLVIYPMYIFK